MKGCLSLSVVETAWREICQDWSRKGESSWREVLDKQTSEVRFYQNLWRQQREIKGKKKGNRKFQEKQKGCTRENTSVVQ